MGETLLAKIWKRHTVKTLTGGRDVLYVDRHYIHEVTSPVAFEGLRKRGLCVFRPSSVVATADHNTPTVDQHLPIKNEQSHAQIELFYKNCKEVGLKQFFPLGDSRNGIVHVIGPELGFTRPGMTVVCGDSHTSTHGALGAVAFGIGTSEVEMVLASNCLILNRPRAMRIEVNGTLSHGVSAKDMALYITSKIGSAGAAGYFVEYSGSAVRGLSMEGRMTLCNMSIESGARGGLVAPDDVTYEYLGMEPIAGLFSDEDAVFDRQVQFDAQNITPMVSWGTNPSQSVAVGGSVPRDADAHVMEYMGIRAGQAIADLEIDYVFLGSCTNGRIEDFEAFADVVRGRHKHPSVTAWLVPGSMGVMRQIVERGIDRVLRDAGFELRQPGCSACLAMNDDKIPLGKRCASTSNRNFEGRQGRGARTMLCSPRTAAIAALEGRIVNI